MKNSVTELRRSLEKRGFKVTVTKGCHHRVTHPEMDGFVIFPNSSRDWRLARNVESEIKRRMRSVERADV